MAESSESDHFSDIFDSTNDLTLVIGHLDRQLKIPGDESADKGAKDESNVVGGGAQPQSVPTAIDDTAVHLKQINKDLPSRSLSSSSSSLNDDHQPGRGMCVLQRAAMEIVDSEGSYVLDLRQVIEGYLADWKERACLKLDELDTLFGNIEQLYEVNSQLFERLSETQGNVELIAQCFLDLQDLFIVLYTTYCTRYPEAISLLTRLLQSTHTNALLTSTQKVLKHTMPLGSYLLKPVQRILKYHLLLDNLRKHCDSEVVNEAYQKMRRVARDIDQMKRALEQKGRVRELCGILDGWLGPELTVLGDLRQEGVLFNNNKPRHVFLFDTMLIIAKAKEDKRLQFKTYIHRKDIMLVEQIPGEPCSFFVIPYSDPKNQFKFVARNRNEKRLWSHQIKAVMLEDLNIPNRAKDLVFQLGDEEDVTSEKIKKWGHAPTPDYLERRHRYRRSEIKERSSAKNRALIKAKEAYEPCCPEGTVCNCALVKNELKEGITKKLNEAAAAAAAAKEPSSPGVEGFKTPVNRYTTEAMPKRILTLKKTRSKTVHQVPSSIFYRNLGDLSPPSAESPPSSSIDLKATIRAEQEASLAGSREQLIPADKADHHRLSTSSSTASSSHNSPNKKSGHQQKKSSTLRASDSHLNYKSCGGPGNTTTTTMSSRDLESAGTGAAVLTRSNTISTEKISKSKKHHSSFYKSWRSVKEEEQQQSVLSFHHLPGSSDLGERIANVDYVDPQQLFCLKATNAILSNADGEGSSSKAVSAGQQQKGGHQPRERDSVMSLTSSSDSVDESARQKMTLETSGESYFERMGDDSYYEDDIERCLEDASLFRDSAIYSDDNERERGRVVSGGGGGGGCPETPPPPVPYKPKHVTELQQKRLRELQFLKRQKSLAAKSSTSTG